VSRLQAALDGDTVKAQVAVRDNVHVAFSATRITRQRTGIHANVMIAQGRNNLAWSVLNVERETDRTRLSNSAHRMLPDALKGDYSKERLGADLHDFCLALWPIYNKQFTATLVEGEPDGRIEWYCPPIVMEGAGTIVFAPGGSGKSHLAQTVAVSVNSGIGNLWYPIRSAPVLYINLERNDRSMRVRLSRINQAMGLSQREPLLMLTARGKSLDNIYEGARASIKEHGVEVVILDSISRTRAGDLNDNSPANQIVDMLNDLCPTWLAIGHTPAADSSKVFGSVMFTNGCDIAVKLTSQTVDETLGIGLEIVKANDTQRGQKQYFAFSFNGTGLAGIRKANVSEFPNLAASASLLEDIRSVLSTRPTTVDDMANELNVPVKLLTAALRGSKAFIRSGNLWALQERVAEPPS
jgi:archaellum biogenesis ATPase FlaH